MGKMDFGSTKAHLSDICRTNEMSDNCAVGLVGCRTTGCVTSPTCHFSDKIRTSEMSDKWDVGLLLCRTSGMSDNCTTSITQTGNEG